MSLKSIGRYEVIGEIARGGMATVYQAHDPRFGRDVAIKMLPREFLHDPTFRERFEREAKTIAMLEHAAIVPVYDFGEEDGQPYLVMRYMTGGTLSDRIREKGGFGLASASTLMERISAALDQAHLKGIVHRDLKPGNILFDQYGDAYLSDFGIVKLAQGAGNLTATGAIGTPAYMSPEQAYGDRTIDGRSDIYSLGVILFEMLTGRALYEADTPMGLVIKHILEPAPDITAIKPDLPPDVEQVIARALAKSPEDRYQKAGEMSEALDAIVHGTKLPDIPIPSTQKTAQLPGVSAQVTAVPGVTQAPVRPAAPPPATANVPVAPVQPNQAVAGQSLPAALAERGWVKWAAIGGGVLAVIVVIMLGINSFGGSTEPEEAAGPIAEVEETPPPATIPPDQAVTRHRRETLHDIEVLNVTLDLKGVETSIGLAAEEGVAFDAAYTILAADENIGVEYDDDNGIGELLIGQPLDRPENIAAELQLGLTNAVPLDIVVTSGMSNTTLDLSQHTVESLFVVSNSGTITLVLPPEGIPSVDLIADGGDIAVSLPADTEGFEVDHFRVQSIAGVIDLPLPANGNYTVALEARGGDVLVALPSELATQINYDGTVDRLGINAPGIEQVDASRWNTATFEDAVNRARLNVLALSGLVEIAEG